jgi:hypothetical protein
MFQLGRTTLYGGRSNVFKYLLGQSSLLCIIIRSMKPNLNIKQINPIYILTFKDECCSIRNAALHTPVAECYSICNAVHASSFSVLTTFTWDGNPNRLTVGPTTRSGLPQELWCNLRRSGFRHYAHTWPLGISWRSDSHDTVDHCLRLKLEPPCHRGLVSLPAALVEVWPVSILLCSGGLAYIWQWRIGYKPQSTNFHKFYCQSCKHYVSWSSLMLHYQLRTGIYCINSLAICKGSISSSVVLIFSSVFTDRVLSALVSHWIII